MKKNFLLIAALAGLASAASAASSDQTNPEAYVLPAYVVTAPRYEPAEQAANARLQEVRQNAALQVASLPAPYLPSLKAAAPAKMSHAAQAPLAQSIVKS